MWPEAQDFISITGHGVKAVVNKKEIIVGNKSLMLDSGIQIPVEADEILADTEAMAQTGILVSINGEVTGIISISDPLKPGAQDVISILKSMKIKSIMVTGDNWGTANSIAKEIGIGTNDVFAEAKPEHKAEKVKELQVRNANSNFHVLTFLSCMNARGTFLHVILNIHYMSKKKKH